MVGETEASIWREGLIFFSCAHLLVDLAARGPVSDEDAHDVHVAPPGGQVQRHAALAVGHIGRRLELEQLQHHLPEDGDEEEEEEEDKKLTTLTHFCPV